MDFQRLEVNSFKKCPDLSIDVAVLEKTRKANVIKLNAGWNDVGNWRSLWDIENKDENGNAQIGDIYIERVKNCYLQSKKKLLVGLGIRDLIIVDTDDAILVADSNASQEIKAIVNKLNSKGRTEGKSHKKVFRPWGYYDLIERGFNWQVKEICVNPRSSLSLQKHRFRSEHWIILKGKATVKLNNKEIFLGHNQSTYIPIGTKHRLSNNENTPLILIEVQFGKYLGEDDIVRYEDNYGRIS